MSGWANHRIDRLVDTARSCTTNGLTFHPLPTDQPTNQPSIERQIPFISMPLLGAGAMFGFYIYLAKNTDVSKILSTLCVCVWGYLCVVLYMYLHA